MRKIVNLIILLFVANIAFGQQISVQNNELKYRITGGTIKTAADKAIFQSKVDALSNRIVADSTALITGLNAKLTKSSNLSDLTSASTARTNLGLGTLATQSGNFTDKATLQISATFSAIGVSTSVRLILVLVDETNNSYPTLYFHDGTNLNWVPTQQL